MRSYRLDELQAAGTQIECTAEEAAAIAATELVEMRPERAGAFRAVPTRNVGAVRVGDLQIEVMPKAKVGVRKLLFLLGYARDPGFRPEDVGASSDTDLLVSMAESLARHTRRALSQGVHHGYVVQDESARTVRGKIRMGDQLAARPGQMFPVEVSFDDFTIDVPENRILRTALRRMGWIPGLRHDLRQELAALDARLDGAQLVDAASPIPRWHPTRLNERYHPALRLAELILAQQSARVADGAVEIAAFVVPMWRVFEDFVAIALAEALRDYPGRTIEQYPAALDSPRAGVTDVPMSVDIVHEVAGVPVIVADAKYKAESAGGLYPNADKYQVLAYCIALGVSRAWLVYAQGDAPVVRTVRNAEVEIVDWPLDLGLPSQEILRRIAVLAAEMSSHAHLSVTRRDLRRASA